MTQTDGKIPPWLTISVAIATLLGVIYVVTKYIVNAETSGLTLSVSKISSDITEIKDDLRKDEAAAGDTNKRIDDLLKIAFNKVVPSANTKPTAIQLEKANKFVVAAQAIDVKLPTLTLAKYGTVVAKASADPSLANIAWSSLQQAVDYRSFLNKDYVPIPKDLTPPPPNSKYQVTINDNGDIHHYATGSHLAVVLSFAGGHVNQEDSARLEPLDKPQAEGSGYGLFVLDGVNIRLGLDGMYMKNVIVRNAEVMYFGGPVRLENVSFVNCKFIFLVRNKPTINFGESVMQANAVYYSTVNPA